mmetsp:Transcript_133790/g.333958  ORF Transcript_133790/g.333958 Transcript_133790/m.333958 type:complete len:207 (-) Transcript_133790:1183-1803(-)
MLLLGVLTLACELGVRALDLLELPAVFVSRVAHRLLDESDSLLDGRMALLGSVPVHAQLAAVLHPLLLLVTELARQMLQLCLVGRQGRRVLVGGVADGLLDVLHAVLERRMLGQLLLGCRGVCAVRRLERSQLPRMLVDRIAHSLLNVPETLLDGGVGPQGGVHLVRHGAMVLRMASALGRKLVVSLLDRFQLPVVLLNGVTHNLL